MSRKAGIKKVLERRENTAILEKMFSSLRLSSLIVVSRLHKWGVLVAYGQETTSTEWNFRRKDVTGEFALFF